MKKDINKAQKLLKQGKLVIFPTETVYGLGCDATNINAIKKIYQIKKRPRNNPLICHYKNITMVKKDFIFNKYSIKLARKFWPGPLTLILEKKEGSNVSPILSNNKKFVGCRIPKNSISQNLLKDLNFPVAAPSANISTKLSSTKIDHLSKRIKSNIFFINGGSSQFGLESTVVDATRKNIKILRLGSISYEEIKKIIPNIKINKFKFSNLSPGQQKKHYSPYHKIRINIKRVLKNEVLLNFGNNRLKSRIMELNLSKKGNLKEASKNFYNYLHILDNCKSFGIAVAPIPNYDLGRTINDRLSRASFIKKF